MSVFNSDLPAIKLLLIFVLFPLLLVHTSSSFLLSSAGNVARGIVPRDDVGRDRLSHHDFHCDPPQHPNSVPKAVDVNVWTSGS
ncbi:hypothetical protein DFH09DRAFT_1158085, partial [Mycena vulgaris]